MRDKIKVYLQYPWGFPDSPYYRYLIQNPFRGLEYVNIGQKKIGVTSNFKKFRALFIIKSLARKSLDFLRIALPNAHKTESTKEFDLIHCAHCLSLNKNKPWVADMESWWSMWLSGHFNKTGQKRVSKIIMSKNCKKIMPWTERTANMIKKYLPEVKNKLDVVYPAMPCPIKLRKKSDSINIIYAARDFKLKGGEIALETIRKLKKKYPAIKEEIYAEVPPEIKQRYNMLNISRLIVQEKLLDRFEKSHILLYPSLMDTFGFAILEAKSRGCIPIVIENGNHTPSVQEIIKNGQTGYYVSADLPPQQKINHNQINKISTDLSRIIENLISNRQIMNEISLNCFEEIRHGKFSIKERNKKLKRIYKEALND